MDNYGLCQPIQDGLPLVRWIYGVSGSCVYGDAAAASWLFGSISFAAWLGAQLPQVAENYMNQSVEGLSWGFLLNWFVGDATNLLGCLLTHQMPFQTLLAAYYVCIDMILGVQYIVYSRRDRRRIIIARAETSWSASSTSDPPRSEPIAIPAKPRSLSATSIKAMVTSSFIASFTRVRAAPVGASGFDSSGFDSSGFDSMMLGRISAWICMVMYLTSRLPQIYKNFTRKSTWGTSMLLFSSALLGNVTYTLSILLSPDARGPAGSAFLRNELPFLLGSAGTVCFDITILLQRFIYGRDRPDLAHEHHSHNSHSSHYSALPTNDTYKQQESSFLHTEHAGSSRLRVSAGYQPVDPEPSDVTPLSLSLQSTYSA